MTYLEQAQHHVNEAMAALRLHLKAKESADAREVDVIPLHPDFCTYCGSRWCMCGYSDAA